MSYFSDKRVLVLGGSRGIGAAIVRRLAADGAEVAFTYVSAKDKAEALARETDTQAVQADSADREALATMIRGQGALDVLVVNAGLYIGGNPLEIAADAVDRLIDVNIRAPYHAVVEAARKMRDGGRIILIGSSNADHFPYGGATAYNMTKSALQGLARGLARDLGPRGITVNVVQPGPTDTEMNPADGPQRERMHAPVAIKRHATAAEVAGMVAYLAGPEAAVVTGSLHTIDSGFGA